MILPFLTTSTRRMLSGWGYSNTITIDNSGNNQIFENAQIEINLVSPFDFTKSDGKDFRVLYRNQIIKHWVDYYDAAAGQGRIYIQVPSMPVKSFDVYLNYGNDEAEDTSDFSIMTRTEVLPAMTHFYPLNADFADKAASDDLTNNGGVSISDVDGGAADFNGTNQYVTANILNTWGTHGALLFKFICKETHNAGDGSKCILSLYRGPNDFVKIGLDNSGNLYCSIKAGGITKTGQTLAPLAGKTNYIAIRHTSDVTICHYNGAYLISNYDMNTGSAAPLTLGAYNDGSISEHWGGYIYDFEVYISSDFDFKNEVLHGKNLKLANRDQREKWDFVRFYPELPSGKVYGENCLLYDDGTLYHWIKRRNNATSAELILITSSDGETWTEPVVCAGMGTGPEDQELHRPFVFKNDGKYYCIYARQNIATQEFDGPLYIIQSTDGQTWTNRQHFLPDTHGEVHNSSIFKDTDGTWWGLVTTRTGSQWITRRITGSDFLAMDYDGDSITSIVDSLEFSDGGTFGGNDLHIISGIYCNWRHHAYDLEGGLPTVINFSTNIDIAANTWETKYNEALATFDNIWAKDQKADPSFAASESKCWLVYVSMDNTPFEGVSCLYEWNGTKEKIVKDITVNIL